VSPFDFESLRAEMAARPGGAHRYQVEGLIIAIALGLPFEKSISAARYRRPVLLFWYPPEHLCPYPGLCFFEAIRRKEFNFSSSDSFSNEREDFHSPVFVAHNSHFGDLTAVLDQEIDIAPINPFFPTMKVLKDGKKPYFPASGNDLPGDVLQSLLVGQAHDASDAGEYQVIFDTNDFASHDEPLLSLS
jgi:hypothetical protein